MAEIDELFGVEKQTSIEPFSKEDWIIQKQENRTAAYQMLETATEELNNNDSLEAYLDIQSRFDKYSVSNALLVAYQNPEATKLYDSATWRKHGAFINKGERGITILEPGNHFTRNDGTEGVSYNAKKVFDISQTNAKQKVYTPRKQDEKTLVKALVKSSPVEVELFNELPEGTNAMYQPQNKKIFIRQGMEGQDIFRALSKEIAFAKLDNGEFNRNKLEFAASAISYIACKRAGYEPEPLKPISQEFINKDVKDKRKDLSEIRDNANSISRSIAKTLDNKNRENSR